MSEAKRYKLKAWLKVGYMTTKPGRNWRFKRVERKTMQFKYFSVEKVVELAFDPQIGDVLENYGFEQIVDEMAVKDRIITQGDDLITLDCGKQGVHCPDADEKRAIHHVKSCGWTILKETGPWLEYNTRLVTRRS